MSPSSLNPMNRPILGIYSDEGVGYERGGAAMLGGNVHPAFDVMLQEQQQQQQQQSAATDGPDSTKESATGQVSQNTPSSVSNNETNDGVDEQQTQPERESAEQVPSK